MEKYVYLFSEGNKDMRELLGGKGANLAEMTKIGLPVPTGFIVTTEACNKYYKDGQKLEQRVITEIECSIKKIENITRKKFGGKYNPLLLSVRSGARASMPGMMDTILNLGLNDEIVESYHGEEQKRFIYDSYRRLIQMYADVVKEVSKSEFESLLNNLKKEKGVKLDTDLTASDLQDLTISYKKLYKKLVQEDFPQDPLIQLIEAISAVFRSWNNERAIYYRKLNEIPDDWGTAVNVQEMVYGNNGLNSGTGVAFTRNPATGEKKLFGEYLINAQGEDVVAGIRTPESIDTLKKKMPDIYNEFSKIAEMLEEHYKDMQDMEFTIENGNLYILQTRNGKRTASAAIKIAVDLVKEGMITREEALLMVDPKQLDDLLHPQFSQKELKKKEVIATGLAASPGAGSGKIYFNAKDAILAAKNNEDVILIRTETSPEDIEGMNHSKGVLTIRGGMTSHAAVVARGMGICCVSGVSDFTIDEEKKTLTTKDGKVYHEQDILSIDGTTGNVYEGLISMEDATISGDFKTFMNWANEFKKVEVRANADTPQDAIKAHEFGAKGIGLCRTEHMFFDKIRIFNFRKMICATNKKEREAALDKLLPLQRNDFEAIYEASSPHQVVIRLLDPPLHEFLPKTEEDIKLLAKELEKSVEDIKNIIDSLKEFNPMMGHRGCRLSITYPEIVKMQTRAIIEAAINVNSRGISVIPEIMVPLIGDKRELNFIRNIIIEEANSVIAEKNNNLKYEIGTMIEVPRAAITSNEIVECADFFSFGTNDLTQMTYGFSRDDASKFLNDYYDQKIFTFDPFIRLDQNGVGELMKIGVFKARAINPHISIGVCGEHGGDPKSIEFLQRICIDYVSVSPYRVPIAILASAQAAIKNGGKR